MKLRAKAVLLFSAMTLGPVAGAVALLVDANRVPVRASEQMLQSAVLAEVAAAPSRLLGDIENDAVAIAAIFARTVDGTMKDEDAIAAVQGFLTTRAPGTAVRLEVPAAKLSSLIPKTADPASVPAVPPELRAIADEHGVAFAITAPGRGVVIARVPTPKKDDVAAYVAMNASLDRLEREVAAIALARFGARDVSLLIATHDRKAVAAFGVPDAKPGASVAALPIWSSLPTELTRSKRISVVTEHEIGGVKMVGALDTIPDLGWIVAIWRPEPVAYASLADMRQRGLFVAAGAVLLAIVVGFMAAGGVTRPVLRLVQKTRLIGRRKWREVEPDGPRTDEIGELDRSLHQMSLELEHGEEEARLRGDLSRFMSKQLVDAIVRGDHSLSLGGKRTEISVLFADVVGFTPLAEARGAEQVVALLNELFSVLTEVVFRHGGTVDKFIGDCIMAVWGAPVPQADHAKRALAAAEDMMRFLETANEGWREKYDLEIRLGIGVNSGEAIVGNIGSDKRMEYTVIGDVVNVAARLEAIAQPNQVLVASTTQELVGDAFALALIGERRLTGRQTATLVYALDIE